MSTKLKWSLHLILFAFPFWLLTACQSSTPGPSEASSTPPPIPSQIPTETARPPIPDSLIICLAAEPSSLYPYGDDSASAITVREAIFDGPFDNLSYELQAVILEKMPSLADGDAAIKRALVKEGDIVLSGNEVLALEPGMLIRPAGCNTNDCEIQYEGGEVEMDQIEVQFSLLPGLVWSDGASLTANDSVFAFEIAKSPDTPNRKAKVNRTSSYLAIDKQTVVWTGIPGYLDPEYSSNFWAPMPQHLWGELSAAALLSDEISTRTPVGWGAYMVEEWRPGQSIRLLANPNYFRAQEGLPKIDLLEFRFVGQENELNLDLILSGECDVLDPAIDLSGEIYQLLDLQDQGEINLAFSGGDAWEVLDIGIHPASFDDGYSLYLGDRPDFFSDVRTRQAIASCLDRQTVVDNILFGQSVVLDNYLSPQHPIYNNEVDTYLYSAENGITLLEEVGWVLEEDNIRVARGVENIPDGTLFEINYWATSGNANQRHKTAERFAANLTACGIKVNLEIYAIDDLYAKAPDGPLFGRNYDLVQYPWHIGQIPPCALYLSNGIAGDPFSNIAQVSWLAEALPNANLSEDAFPWGWGGWNSPGYANPAYDDACSAALSTLPGMPAYEAHHFLSQEIFARDLPVIPLYLSTQLGAARPDICNFSLDASVNSGLWNIEEIAYGAHCQQD